MIGDHTRPNDGLTVDWLTPPSIVEALGSFDLDPCACRGMPWRTADLMISPPDDGLSVEWPKGARVWLNPPYGRQTARWLKKLSQHGQGTALVFARTETRMFHSWVWPHARALAFFEGRLHFHYPDGARAVGNAGGPSVLVAYGRSDAEALEAACANREIAAAFVSLM